MKLAPIGIQILGSCAAFRLGDLSQQRRHGLVLYFPQHLVCVVLAFQPTFRASHDHLAASMVGEIRGCEFSLGQWRSQMPDDIIHRRRKQWISFYTFLLTPLETLDVIRLHFTYQFSPSHCFYTNCDVICNQGVPGSNPGGGTSFKALATSLSLPFYTSGSILHFMPFLFPC